MKEEEQKNDEEKVPILDKSKKENNPTAKDAEKTKPEESKKHEEQKEEGPKDDGAQKHEKSAEPVEEQKNSPAIAPAQ